MTALTENQKITHLLNRLSFGPTPEDIEVVKSKGIVPYLEEQLEPEKIHDRVVDAKLAKLKTLRLSSHELLDFYPPRQKVKAMGLERPPLQGSRYVIRELQQAKLLRAVYSRRQLYEVMVDFWTNHFNVFAAKGADRWLITAYDRDTIRPRALGRFRDLLLATAQSPAMLFYLDNWLSVGAALKPPSSDATLRRGINENYARELMELHTLSVDGGYTQKDVGEAARCFTGWTIRRTYEQPEFVFESRFHDHGKKLVLGSRIPAGGEIEDGLKIIDLLARHPATARFIATKLVRRFVSDDPPSSLVARVAGVFLDSDGDIKEALRAVVNSPEFFSPAAVGTKVKKPLEFVASALRFAGAETDASPGLLGHLERMGEPLFLAEPPTGFPDFGAAWTSPDMLLARINFAIDFSSNRIPGTKIDAATPAAHFVAPEFQRR
ncbi:MAG: DUF1800 domain-containing protein [Candidatus Binatia bacterium]